jgi:hypothetical protein
LEKPVLRAGALLKELARGVDVGCVVTRLELVR